MRRTLLVILGFAIGGVCLWLAARDVDWAQAARTFRQARMGDVFLGLAAFGLDQFVRAWRWRTLLASRAVGQAQAVQALLAGFAVNTLVPARLGEFYRAHDLGRRTGLSGSGVLASIVLERLLDLIAVIFILALCLALAGGAGSANRHFLIGAAILVSAIVVTLVGLVVLLSRYSPEDLPGRLHRLPAGDTIVRRGGAMLTNFVQALQAVRTRHFPVAIILTAPVWVLELAAIWFLCRAVGLQLELIALLSLAGALALSVMVPTAPGYVGSYQIVFVVVLAQFAIGATQAVVAATAVQLCLIGGFTLLGLAVIAWTALARR